MVDYVDGLEHTTEEIEATEQQCSSCGFVVAKKNCDYCGLTLYETMVAKRIALGWERLDG